MRKSKRGPALFELLKEEDVASDGTLKTPVPRGAPRRSGSPPVAAERGLFERESPPITTAPPVVEEAADRSPMIELDGARIRFSLTSVSAAVVVFVAAVGLVVTYEVGRRSGESSGVAVGYEAGRASFAADAVSEIEAARAQPPETELVSDLLREPAAGGMTAEAASGEPSVGPRWVRGHTYTVAQEFSAGRDADAERAMAFLSQHGVDTAMVRLSGGSVQLITTKGFNRNESAQQQMADEFLRKIHTIGANYYASGGGYKLEGYFKKLTNDQW